MKGMMESRPTHDYAAFLPCGCLIGLCSDLPDDKKYVAKKVAEWIRRGCNVQRMSTEEVRKLLDEKGMGCKCDKEKQPGLFAEVTA